MSNEQVVLKGELRNDIGKGASRRLRRLQNLVPAIIYGGKKAPLSISLPHNKVIRELEEESFYASVFTVEVDGKKQKVILKDLQRHPYKAQIMHMDLQRISATESITKMIPLHYLNEEESVGVKAGGAVSKTMTEVEVKCLAKNLPSHIDVDLLKVAMDETLHLTNIKLPEGVELTADMSDSAHDSPIVSIHMPKVIEEPEETVVVEDADAADAEKASDTSDGDKDKS